MNVKQTQSDLLPHSFLAPGPPHRLCVISNAIVKPFDEGVKNFVYNIIKHLSQVTSLLALGPTNDIDGEISAYCKKAIPSNKLFLSLNFKKAIDHFEPDLIFYIPTACATVFSFFRAKVLKCYASYSKVVLVTLQPRSYSFFDRVIIPFFVPDLVLTQSAATKDAVTDLGCTAAIIPPAVDLQKFVPLQSTDKHLLKKQYGFPIDKFVVLHVGHINMNRNTQLLKQIQAVPNIQAVVVGSASYPEDRQLVKELEECGVIVIRKYIKEIQTLYQACDCYVFPVFSKGACIETPLSVFEAMACNLPVVTTRFGPLPALFSGGHGLIYIDSEEDLIPSLTEAQLISKLETRDLVIEYSWENLANVMLSEARSLK